MQGPALYENISLSLLHSELAQNANKHEDLHLIFTTFPWIICCPLAIFLDNLNSIYQFWSYSFTFADCYDVAC